MTYKITFDTSTDAHSTERRSTTVEAFRLGAKIISLQSKGNIIYKVEQIG